MKNNHFLLALALCIGLQFNTSMYSSEESYFSQALKSATSTVSSYWQSIQNTVSNWSTRKKLFVVSALLASLATIYNRETLMALVDDAQIKAQQIARELREKQGRAVAYRYYPTADVDGTGSPILNQWQIDRFKRDIMETRGSSIADRANRYQRSQEAKGYVKISTNPDFEEAKRQLTTE